MADVIQGFSQIYEISILSFFCRYAGSFDAVKKLPPRQVSATALNKKSPLPFMTGGFGSTNVYEKLSSQIHKLSQEIVRRGNDSRIGLKTTLHRNHIHQFIPQVYIGSL